MRTFLGKGAKPGRLYKIRSLHSPFPLPFGPAKKEAKKPPLIPRRGARPKGPAGPFGNPGGSDGVARDGLRFSQGKGSLLQYRFFPAGTLIRAPVPKPPPAFAGGPVCGKRLPCPFACRSRSVRRGRMHAARGRLPDGDVFWSMYAVPLFVGEAYMPPGRGERSRGVCGEIDRSRYSVGRAFTPAANIAFFKNHRCSGVKTPPYRARQIPGRPGQRAMPRTVSRAASMPPLRIDQTPSQPKNGMAKQTWRAACMRPLQCGAYAIRTIPGRAQHRNFSFLFFNF